jgi:carbonic anhydrase/acetyltransferase-like protein (isoleucine patch superfamily)
MHPDLERAREFALQDALKIAPTAWVAPNATLIGDVTLEDEASVWFNCVLRGDIAPIRVGAQSNIQDGCILHVGAKYPCTIGRRVSLGHGAIVHGATVEDDCLIAIRATVLNGAVIGRGSIVGAGAVVPENAVIPPNSLVLGVPGKVKGELNEDQRQGILMTAQAYLGYVPAYKKRYR